MLSDKERTLELVINYLKEKKIKEARNKSIYEFLCAALWLCLFAEYIAVFAFFGAEL